MTNLSPCVNVCRLDDAGQTCLGCGRTLGEITAWSSLGAQERKAIMARLTKPPGEAPRKDDATTATSAA